MFVCYLGIPSTEETMSTLLTAMQSGSQAKLGSQQYPECPVSEWSGTTNSITSSASNNGQAVNVCVRQPVITCCTKTKGPCCNTISLRSQYTELKNNRLTQW